MRAQTEERPILLLDDILSELDPTRRGFVLEQAGREGQTRHHHHRPDDFPPAFLGRARVYGVEHGGVRRPCGEPGATAESATDLYRPRTRRLPASSGRSASPASRHHGAAWLVEIGWSYGPTGRQRARNGQSFGIIGPGPWLRHADRRPAKGG